VIAILGVGAIGGVCVAHLASRRADVVGCARRPLEALELRGPQRELRVRVRVETDPQRVPPPDWLLLATKAHQVEGASAWLSRLAGAGTRVAVLQNGVEHVDRVAAWAPPERVVPVVVDCPATVVATGTIELRREPRLTVPDDANGRAFADLFVGTGAIVECTRDWRSAAWQKLCINAVGGALAALAGRPLSELRHPGRAALAERLALESAAVARAEGARVERAFAEGVARRAAGSDGGGLPSILADRLAGRPLEIDARNGAVVRCGARHGVPTPANARVCELLADAHLHDRDLLAELAGEPR
jgi:2-dehydropantoate 2-reductase